MLFESINNSVHTLLTATYLLLLWMRSLLLTQRGSTGTAKKIRYSYNNNNNNNNNNSFKNNNNNSNNNDNNYNNNN